MTKHNFPKGGYPREPVPTEIDLKKISQEFIRRRFPAQMNGIAEICHEDAVEAGWWTDLETGKPVRRNHGELIALIHTELSEAFEGLRKDKMDEHLPHRKSAEVEFADTIIRICDLAFHLNFDLGNAIIEKLAYNKTRADHKLENRRKPGGKKF